MISLIVPPKDQISRVASMLANEYGTASNIKSRVNRLSVLGAITSVQQRLKLYNRVPDNGLVLYCGTVLTAEGKEKKLSIDFEPFKPINTSLYLCDNKFHTEVRALAVRVFALACGVLIVVSCDAHRRCASCSRTTRSSGSLSWTAAARSTARSAAARAPCCTNSRSTCPRSTGAAASRRCVSRVCARKSAQTTCERCVRDSFASACLSAAGRSWLTARERMQVAEVCTQMFIHENKVRVVLCCHSDRIATSTVRCVTCAAQRVRSGAGGQRRVQAEAGAGETWPHALTAT